MPFHWEEWSHGPLLIMDFSNLSVVGSSPTGGAKLHTVQPDRATPRKLRRRSSRATVITNSQNIRYGSSQIWLVQLMRVSASPAPLAMASHPSQRGRTRVDAMTQPQQIAKLPRATRPLANAASP